MTLRIPPSGLRPRPIQFLPTSVELACWHEAAHIQQILPTGQVPAFVQINPGPPVEGQTQAKGMKFWPHEVKDVASAGFAIEHWLFQNARLADSAGRVLDHTDPSDMKRFFNEALGNNASKDKEQFFGANMEQPNKCWPKRLDLEFGNHALTLPLMLPTRDDGHVSAFLDRRDRLCRQPIEGGPVRHRMDEILAGLRRVGLENAAVHRAPYRI